MHDAGMKTTTADALPEILQYGLANGYTFLPITKDTVPVHHADLEPDAAGRIPACYSGDILL